MKGWITASVVLFIGLIVLMMWGCPNYNVWQQEKAGQASLAEATYSKQIIEREAEARKLAAVYDAEAEIIRAEGMAKAMEIENGQLTPTYVQYLWIRLLTERGNGDQIIYIPTEAMLPVLEAKRLE